VRTCTRALGLAAAALLLAISACQTTTTIGRKLQAGSGESGTDGNGSGSAGSDASGAGESESSGSEASSATEPSSDEAGTSEGNESDVGNASSEAGEDSAASSSGEDDVCPQTGQRLTCSGCMRAECCVEIDTCTSDETCKCHWGCAGAFPGSNCTQACDPLEPPSSMKYTTLIECGMRNCTTECQPDS